MSKNIVLVIEDDKNIWETIKQAIEAAVQKIEMKAEQVFNQDLNSLNGIKETSCDNYVLIVLDLNLKSEANSVNTTIEKLIEISKKYFIPGVIYSAYSNDIGEDLKKRWRFIRIVTKGSTNGVSLEEAIAELLKDKKGLMDLEAGIRNQFLALSIETMDEIFQDKNSVSEEAVRAMMISRLTGFLTNNMNSMIETGSIPAEAKVIYPPLQDVGNLPIAMGDILKDSEGNLWLAMSPTCDMVIHSSDNMVKNEGLKIKNVLLMRCFVSVTDSEKYAPNLAFKFQDDNEKTIPIKVPTKVSGGGILIIHTKLYETKSYDVISKWTKVLSLASPYAEDIKATFMRDIMRIGTPETVPKSKELIKQFIKDNVGK